MPDQFKSNFLVQGWLVLLLCLGFGGTLSGVQMKLSPIIEENKKNEIFKIIPGLISADSKTAPDQKNPYSVAPFFMNTEKEGGKKSYAVFKVNHTEGGVAGWAVRAAGQGYADRIELILGLSPSADTITGLFILEQKETPGLGNKISDPRWRNQFIGKKTEDAIVAIKGKAANENEIDAITGATISSGSVCRIVNQIVEDVKTPLKAKLNETLPNK